MDSPPNQRNPDFEEQIAIDNWWQKQDYRVGMVYAVYPDQKVIEFCTCFKTPCSDSSNRLQDTITAK